MSPQKQLLVVECELHRAQLLHELSSWRREAEEKTQHAGSGLLTAALTSLGMAGLKALLGKLFRGIFGK